MGKFVIKDAKGGVMFNLKAGNNEIILTSEIYNSMASCKNGIESVRKSVAAAAIEDQTVAGFEKQKAPKFEVYTDKAGEIRFRLKAGNNEIIGTGESYKAKASCLKGIESIRRNAADAEIVDKREKK